MLYFRWSWCYSRSVGTRSRRAVNFKFLQTKTVFTWSGNVGWKVRSTCNVVQPVCWCSQHARSSVQVQRECCVPSNLESTVDAYLKQGQQTDDWADWTENLERIKWRLGSVLPWDGLYICRVAEYLRSVKGIQLLMCDYCLSRTLAKESDDALNFNIIYMH